MLQLSFFDVFTVIFESFRARSMIDANETGHSASTVLCAVTAIVSPGIATKW